MTPQIWTAGDHQIAHALVRQEPRPSDRLVLREGRKAVRWTVLWVDKDPHGWRVTATRCLESCREHRLRR